jgi:heat shock protein HslJ
MALRRSSVALTFVVGAAFACLTACETAVSNEDGDADQLRQEDWVAEAIAGKPVVNAGRVTLSFADARISGRSGCNLYSGPAEYGRGTIKVGPLISTKMACQEEGVMAQESAYLNALQSAERYGIGADGKLTITTAVGDLVYDSAARQVRPEG